MNRETVHRRLQERIEAAFPRATAQQMSIATPSEGDWYGWADLILQDSEGRLRRREVSRHEAEAQTEHVPEAEVPVPAQQQLGSASATAPPAAAPTPAAEVRQAAVPLAALPPAAAAGGVPGAEPHDPGDCFNGRPRYQQTGGQQAWTCYAACEFPWPRPTYWTARPAAQQPEGQPAAPPPAAQAAEPQAAIPAAVTAAAAATPAAPADAEPGGQAEEPLLEPLREQPTAQQPIAQAAEPQGEQPVQEPVDQDTELPIEPIPEIEVTPMDAAEEGAAPEAQTEPVPEPPDIEPMALEEPTEEEREAAATVVNLRHSMSSSLGASPETIATGTPTQQPSPLAGSTPRRLPSVKTPDEGSRTPQASADLFVTAAGSLGMASAFVEGEIEAEEILRAAGRGRGRGQYAGEDVPGHAAPGVKLKKTARMSTGGGPSRTIPCTGAGTAAAAASSKNDDRSRRCPPNGYTQRNCRRR